MEQTIAILERQIALLTEKQEQCADIIKQLSGYSTTDNFALAFSVKSVKVVTFDIQESDVNFAMSFFMAWHSTYSRQIKEQRRILSVVKCGAGLPTVKL